MKTLIRVQGYRTFTHNDWKYSGVSKKYIVGEHTVTSLTMDMKYETTNQPNTQTKIMHIQVTSSSWKHNCLSNAQLCCSVEIGAESTT